jgi:hypothetical protein
MCARVARSKGSSLSAARDALLRDGAYLLEQLAAHDAAHTAPADAKGKGKASAPMLAAGAFATGLRAEMASAAANAARGAAPPAPGGGIVIRDAADTAAAMDLAPAGPTSTSAAQMSADEAMARAMADGERAKETAKAKKAVARAAAAAAGGEAYIKIDETEFAEYYPAPAEYVKARAARALLRVRVRGLALLTDAFCSRPLAPACVRRRTRRRWTSSSWAVRLPRRRIRLRHYSLADALALALGILPQ